MPRKLSAVSARIMPGIAKVTEAMIWLVMDGTMWRRMIGISRTPSKRAAMTKSSVFSDKKAPAHLARQRGPADQGQQHSNRKVDAHGRPSQWNGGGEPHPERDRRQRAQNLNRALDQVIDQAAVITGDAAQYDAKQEAQPDADKTDRHRHAGTVNCAAQDIAPQPVGAEEVHRIAGLRRAYQVQVKRDPPPQLVFFAADE